MIKPYVLAFDQWQKSLVQTEAFSGEEPITFTAINQLVVFRGQKTNKKRLKIEF